MNKGSFTKEMFKDKTKHPRWKGGVSNFKNIEDRRAYQKNYHKKVRDAVIEALGAECVECGFSDKRALQIDHINGGGSMERKTLNYNKNHKGSYHASVLKSFLNKENKYQLLCANCNWIKRFDRDEINK